LNFDSFPSTVPALSSIPRENVDYSRILVH
jgi:hypothetical protein